MKQFKTPQWPSFTNEEIKKVTDILKSGKVNYRNGTVSKLFEKNFSNFLKVKYAIGLFNGSIALETALRAIELKKGDEVIVTPKSFIISASIPILFGAKPIFADIDTNTLGLTLESIRSVFTKKTKAIIAVHLGGTPCDIINIKNFAKKNNIYLIEDCSQAHGAEINKRKVGSFGDAAIFSFCNDKIISTGGEGGIFVTNNKHIYNRAYEYKDHGKDINKIDKYENSYQYIHKTFGNNYRITEIQSALGLIQLKKIKINLANRKKLADGIYKIAEKYSNIFYIPKLNNAVKISYYCCYLILKLEKLNKGQNLNKIITAFRKTGIQCSVGSCPELYKEKTFNKFISKNFTLKNAKYLSNRTLCLKINHNYDERLRKKYLNIFENVIKKIK